MNGETQHDWMDRFARAALGGLAGVLGLIGRNWISFLGWSLFVMAISEPAHALGQEDCDAMQTKMAACEQSICGGGTCTAYGSVQMTADCEGVPLGGESGGNQMYRIDRTIVYTGPGAPGPQKQEDYDRAVCLACSGKDDVGNPDSKWSSPTWPPEPTCAHGCNYHFKCGGPLCGLSNGDSYFGFGTQEPGDACVYDPGSDMDESDEDPCAGKPFCIEPDATCDGYKGTFNGNTICVPKGDDSPPCDGPFCDEPDPPGDADNKKDSNGDESSDDEPDAEFEYWYQDTNGDPKEDTDFFIPSADETGGCNPCPPPNDPSDPRDQEEEEEGGEEGGGGGEEGSGGGGDTGGEDCGEGPCEGGEEGGGGGGEEGGEDCGEGPCEGGEEGGGGGGEEGECTEGPCDGGGGEEGEEGSASGGATCAAQPLCSGDPVTCMVAFQTWQTRCAVVDLGEQLLDVSDMDDSMGTEDLTPPTFDVIDTGDVTFDDSGWLGGGAVCPDMSVAILGASYDLDELGHLCRFLQIGAGLVLVFAAWASSRIIAGGIA